MSPATTRGELLSWAKTELSPWGDRMEIGENRDVAAGDKRYIGENREVAAGDKRDGQTELSPATTSREFQRQPKQRNPTRTHAQHTTHVPHDDHVGTSWDPKKFSTGCRPPWTVGYAQEDVRLTLGAVIEWSSVGPGLCMRRARVRRFRGGAPNEHRELARREDDRALGDPSQCSVGTTNLLLSPTSPRCSMPRSSWTRLCPSTARRSRFVGARSARSIPTWV